MKTKDMYTMAEIKAAAKEYGCKITKNTMTLNGSPTYEVEGKQNWKVCTKSELIRLFML